MEHQTADKISNKKHDNKKDITCPICDHAFHLGAYTCSSRVKFHMLRYALWFSVVSIGGILASILFLTPLVANAQAGSVIFQSGTANENSPAGFDSDDCTTNVCAYSFEVTPSSDLLACGATTRITQNNHSSPTDLIRMDLYTDGPETGSLLNSTSTEIGNLPSGTTPLTASSTLFQFPSCQHLDAGEDYFFTFITDSTAARTVHIARNSANTTGHWKIAGWQSSQKEIDFQLYGYVPDVADYLFEFTDLSFTDFSSSTIDCSSYSGGLFSSSTLQALSCYGRETIEKAADYLFLPNASSTGINLFNEGMENFKNVFPFNIFFNFYDVVADNISNYSYQDNSIELTFPDPLNLDFELSSSTLETAVGSSTISYIRQVEEYMLWAMLGLGIVMFII